MQRPLAADIEVGGDSPKSVARKVFFATIMLTPSHWKCPGCGALITLPGGGETKGNPPACADETRLDQLAQAVCGCWVRTLSDGEFSRFVLAVMGEKRQRRSA